jgi:hypothetical protein
MWVVIITAADGTQSVVSGNLPAGWRREGALEWAHEHTSAERGWNCQAVPVENANASYWA